LQGAVDEERLQFAPAMSGPEETSGSTTARQSALEREKGDERERSQGKEPHSFAEAGVLSAGKADMSSRKVAAPSPAPRKSKRRRAPALSSSRAPARCRRSPRSRAGV